MEPGFDICWVDLPKKALVDAQISAEYVAQAVLSLAKRSTTGKVSIIGHSQGAGFNPQWALTFFPSIRSYVAAYVALAPDFHGTLDSTFCKFLPTSICPQSIWQQAAGSHYIRAQNIDGYRALVPTTVIYTSTDEVVTPEVGLTYSSRLDGATIIGVQDLDICGPAKMLGHASMLIDPAPFALAYNALINGGNAIRSDFALTSCVSYPVPPSVDFGATVNLIESAYKDLASGFFPAETVSSAEPPLRKYVCDRYPDQGFSCA
ncbi:hypothetical protein BOTBODRAFT_553497 [Botryobasidium botryosum FD-172 SS1]|uniref:Uncharacterized protein n=1 Tax=Botryobasidium botryosum (strain FD-172 SS1) TaxID=930990 RepID=A0A067N234_BOTB1|nr:hypothetical protein BOTBODRAFT_553497 [Botryobasidium botryosum FD-172 SS1]